jgi:hypothetical protein
MATDKTCSNCAYYHPTDKDRLAGECHIYPPRAADPAIQWPIQWPKVDALDWCGQFLSRGNLYEKKKKK